MKPLIIYYLFYVCVWTTDSVGIQLDTHDRPDLPRRCVYNIYCTTRKRTQRRRNLTTAHNLTERPWTVRKMTFTFTRDLDVRIRTKADICSGFQVIVRRDRHAQLKAIRLRSYAVGNIFYICYSRCRLDYKPQSVIALSLFEWRSKRQLASCRSTHGQPSLIVWCIPAMGS